MKIDYEYLCDNIGHLTSIPTRVYRNNDLKSSYANIEFVPDLVSLLWDDIQSDDEPIQYHIIQEVLYFGVVKIERSNQLFIIGPTSHIPVSSSQVIDILKSLREPLSRQRELGQFLADIPNYPLENFLHILGLIHYILNNEKITIQEIVQKKSDRLPLLPLAKDREVSGESHIHNTFELEKKLVAAITYGKTAELRSMLQAPPTGRIGTIAHDDLRQRKNALICSATLASRAAIAGGVPHEIAFSLSDSYIQKAELLQDHTSITQINIDMLITFCQEVEKVVCHGSKSKLVIDTSRYVIANIDRMITTAQISDNFNMSREYYCKRFKEETGITVNEFITEQKLNEAKRLLESSDLSIVQISVNLGYSSQGYFQNIFKKHTGMTPLQYRKKTTS